MTFSDGQCRLAFPAPYKSAHGAVVAEAERARYRLTRTPIKLLDPAQHLANLRRLERDRGGSVRLLAQDGLDGLEIRRAHSVARVFVVGQTAYKAEVSFAAREPAGAVPFVCSLRFPKRAQATYIPQRMSRYDAQLRDVPVQKCAENLLEISSLLTGFQIKHKKFPSALSSLHTSLTAAYGYRRVGAHYLLYCSGHRHKGLPPHYPRSDDALRTLLGPGKPYRPGY